MSHLTLIAIINSNIKLTLLKTQFCNWRFRAITYLLIVHVCGRKKWKIIVVFRARRGAQRRQTVTRTKNHKINKQAVFFVNIRISSIGAPPTDWSPNKSFKISFNACHKNESKELLVKSLYFLPKKLWWLLIGCRVPPRVNKMEFKTTRRPKENLYLY